MVYFSPNFSVEDHRHRHRAGNLNRSNPLTGLVGKLDGCLAIISGDMSYRLIHVIIHCLKEGIPFVLRNSIDLPYIRNVLSQIDELQGIKLVGLEVAPNSVELVDTIDGHPFPEELEIACLYLTSGTTGFPKIVPFTWPGIMNALTGLSRKTGYERWGGRVLQINSVEFDAFIEELLMTALAGGTFVIPPTPVKKSIHNILEIIIDHDIQVLDMPTGLFNALTLLRGKRVDDRELLLVIGGQSYYAEAVRTFREIFPNCVIVNSYGPTEATITCSAWVLSDSDIPRQIIGIPYEGVKWRIDEDEGSSSVGELLLSGIQTRNLESYRSSSLPGKWFRTGDLVRENKDGSLEYISRLDAVEKIAGRRVNLDLLQEKLQNSLGRRVKVRKITTAQGIDLIETTMYESGASLRNDSAQKVREILLGMNLPSVVKFEDKIMLSERGKEVHRYGK
ncbi:putative non-ribosomal peptide synthetase [Corynebacterium casei]|uniref:AMP-binding protein n=1 Tax=Corynebacterium casei TaxID=160386 RepID=UPI0009D491EB|nr:AMP-binding protein [Corynebacterium casei]SLM93124.1 putative non-ribosomal peptide synthetase [Corynebacterium casei]